VGGNAACAFGGRRRWLFMAALPAALALVCGGMPGLDEPWWPRCWCWAGLLVLAAGVAPWLGLIAAAGGLHGMAQRPRRPARCRPICGLLASSALLHAGAAWLAVDLRARGRAVAGLRARATGLPARR
jgi:hypothetical protein